MFGIYMVNRYYQHEGYFKVVSGVRKSIAGESYRCIEMVLTPTAEKTFTDYDKAVGRCKGLVTQSRGIRNEASGYNKVGRNMYDFYVVDLSTGQNVKIVNADI